MVVAIIATLSDRRLPRLLSRGRRVPSIGRRMCRRGRVQLLTHLRNLDAKRTPSVRRFC